MADTKWNVTGVLSVDDDANKLAFAGEYEPVDEEPPPEPEPEPEPPAERGQSGLSVNIPQLNYFDPICGIFLDLRMQVGDWGYGGGDRIPLRPDGYPVEVEAGSGTYAGFQARIPAKGEYVATFEGDGELAVDFGGRIVSHTRNRYLLDLEGSDEDRVGLVIVRSERSDPVTNLVIVPIAHEQDHATVLIHAALAKALKPFQALRFMDTFRINDVGSPYNTTSTWTDRVKPDYAIQGGAKGPALEHIIAVCNLNKSDLWLNIPEQAETSWIDGAAELVAEKLDAPLKAYLEFGNELWNDAFSNGRNVLARAIDAGFPDTYDSRFGFQAMMGRYAREKFVEAFGGSDARVKHVLASQTGFDARIDILLDYPSTIGLYTDGDAAYEHADYLATAPYISGERADDPGFASKSETDILTAMLRVDIPAVLAEVQRNKQQAKARNLGFAMYEGGQHLYYWDSGNTAVQAKIKAVNRHKGMFACMLAYLFGNGAHFDGPLCLYTLVSEYSHFGCWGWMEDLDDELDASPRQCPKMDAALAYAQASVEAAAAA
jgi:hypothetical protein